jgi:hypothetical protein
MWSYWSFTTILFKLFKLITGTADDGSVSNNKNPSSSLIVRLQVNNKSINAMIDTGSAKSIIHINTLRKLIYRPYIKYQNNTHRTANNTQLHTIGLVKLKINVKNIPTFILAEVAVNLCTGLVLGNDWIKNNEIDIITTKQCIRKRQGSYIVTAPFSTYYQETYSVPLIHHNHRLQQQPKKYTKPDLNCRVCQEKHTTKKKLFRHLHQTAHYSNREINGSIEHVKNGKNCAANCFSRYPVNSSYDDKIKQRSNSTQTDIQRSIVGAVTTPGMNHKRKLLKTTTSTPTTMQPAKQLNQLKTINQITVFTTEQLKHHQQQDLSIKKIIENIDKKPFINKYCMENGILCRYINRFNGIIAVPVVPKFKVNEILLAYHNSSMNGVHFGKDRTYYKIRDRYYWPRMYDDIAQHVRSCPNCSINNYSIGDFIYVKRLGLNYKLTHKYYGPYQIIQQLNESTYRIQNPNDLHEIINIHVNQIR